MIVFDRYKSCHIDQVTEHSLKVTSSMCDSYHEITVVLTVNISDGMIQEAGAEFVRMPDMMCRQTACMMEKLVGVTLGKGITKTARQLVGGRWGCTHLVDLVVEAAKAFLQGQYTIRFRDLNNFQDAKDTVSRELAGTCLYHTRNAENLK